MARVFLVVILILFCWSCAPVERTPEPAVTLSSTVVPAAPISSHTPTIPRPRVILLDDFENPTVGIQTRTDKNGSTAECVYDEAQSHSGNYSLRLSYVVIPEGVASCLRGNLPENGRTNFSNAEGISFWYRADRSGQQVNFFIQGGAPETSYRATFTTSDQSTEGWMQQRFSWREFSSASGTPESAKGFDFSRVEGYGFEPAQGADRIALQLWIDDLNLVVAAAAPHPYPAYTPSSLAATFDDSLCDLQGNFPILGRVLVVGNMTLVQNVEGIDRYQINFISPSSDGNRLDVWIVFNASPGPNEMKTLPKPYNTRTDVSIHTREDQVVGNKALVWLTLHSIPDPTRLGIEDYPCDFVVEDVRLP